MEAEIMEQLKVVFVLLRLCLALNMKILGVLTIRWMLDVKQY